MAAQDVRGTLLRAMKDNPEQVADAVATVLKQCGGVSDFVRDVPRLGVAKALVETFSH